MAFAAAVLMQVDWRADLDAAKAEAKGRLVVVHFALPDRPLTKAMDEETFAAEEVAILLRTRFVAVRLDPSTKAEAFAAVIGGRAGLATAVVDGEGDVISVLSGHADPKAFVAFLEQAERGRGEVRAASGPVERGEAYLKLNSLRRAERCFQEAATQTDPPRASNAHERLARMSIMRGRNRDARGHLDACRQLDPVVGRSERALLTEGLIWSAERALPEATKALEESVARFPEGPETDHVRYALGVTLHEAGKNVAALATLEKLVALRPASPWTAAAKVQIEHIRHPRPDHEH